MSKKRRKIIRTTLALAMTATVAGLCFGFWKSRQALADRAIRRVCQSGSIDNCLRLAELLKKRDRPRLAISALRYACARDHIQSCWNAGLAERVMGLPGDGHRFFEKACALGEASRCFAHGMMYRLERDEKNALFAFDRGCEKDDVPSCRESGPLADVLGDGTRAFQAYHRLCYVHHRRESCGRLAYLHWIGQTPMRAMQAAMHTCRKGDKRPCLALVPFPVQRRESPAVVSARRLNLLEQSLTDFFNYAGAVRRDGRFSGFTRDIALQIYQARVAPSLQRAHLEFQGSARLSRQPAAKTAGWSRGLRLRYARVLALSSQALQQDLLFLQTGLRRHLSTAHQKYREANDERDRIHAILRKSRLASVSSL